MDELLNENTQLKALLKIACTCEEFLLEMITKEQYEYMKSLGIVKGEWHD